MLGGQFGAFGGWSVCSGEGKKGPFLGVVNLERYRLVNLSVFSNPQKNRLKNPAGEHKKTDHPRSVVGSLKSDKIAD